MNERIKELAERAGMKPCADMAKFGMNEDMNPYNCQEFMLEKFAELIVRECIEQCNKKDPRPDRYSDWEEFAESRKVRECITSIKEHFGVE